MKDKNIEVELEDDDNMLQDKGLIDAIKKATPPPVRLPQSIKFWCNVCTANKEIFKKEKGQLAPQQICLHMTFKEVVY